MIARQTYFACLFINLGWLCMLQGQCLVNPYIPMKTPGEELGLLPDTPSYYMEREIYFKDTLRRTVTEMTYHNYGDYRIAVHNDEFGSVFAQHIISLLRINDSLWMQTAAGYYPEQPTLDTLYAWIYDGQIRKAISNDYGVKTFHFVYNDAGQLVQKTVNQDGRIFTDCRYSYDDQHIVEITCTRNQKDSLDITYTYTDTLITELHTMLSGGKQSLRQCEYYMDACGNKSKVRWHYKSAFTDAFEPSLSIDYTYAKDGTYQYTTGPSHFDSGQLVQVHPGYFHRERTAFVGEGRVWVRRRIPIN